MIVIMILQMIITNNKSMSDISKSLKELLTELQDTSFPLIVSHEIKQTVTKQPSRCQEKIIYPDLPHEPFQEADFHNLKVLQEPDLMFVGGIKTRLNQIWNSFNRANCKQSLFARSFHNQRRCIKSLKSYSNQQYMPLPRSNPDWHSFTVTNHRGQSENISFNQQDLDSVKYESISFTIILSYISILRVAGHIPLKSYVFPLTFVERLFGSAYNFSSYDEVQVCNHIQKNFSLLQSTLNINILDYDYLIFPILVEKSYKCIIVQGINESIRNSKTNIILCNFRPQIGLIFCKTIKNYLILCVNQQRKESKLSMNTKQISTIYLMLPREFNHLESGIYVMLYLEFLFARKCAELQKIRMPENHKKLHLFPRSLALVSRQHIWNLFVSLEAEPSDKNKLNICKDYIDKRSRFCERTIAELDYDKIDGRQLQKYLIINDVSPNKNQHTLEYEKELNYYLDPEVNYYLSQSFS